MNVSLSKKVTWLLVAVLGLSLLTVGGYAVREQEVLAQNMMREWVSQCSGRYVEILGHALVESDLDQVTDTGQALVKSMPVAYCEIRNQSGDVAFQEGFRQQDPVALFVWPVPHYNAKGMIETVGRLTLVLSPGPMTVAVSRIGQTISIAGIVTLCMGLFLGGLAIRSILGQPMRQLVDGADRMVYQGDLAHHIDMDRDDEIGQLAKAINTMADELRGLMLKDEALAHYVNQACQQHETLPHQDGQSQAPDAVDFMKDHIEQSGGKFWVESEQGATPVFHFTLPDKNFEARQKETKGACK